MGIFKGLSEKGTFYVGSSYVKKMYLGDTKVFLSYDAEIEYLESTGTQFIISETDFIPTDSIYCRFCIDESGNDVFIFSPSVYNVNGNRFAFGVTEDKYTFAFGDQFADYTLLLPETFNDYNIHDWLYTQRVVSVPSLNISRDLSSVTFNDSANNIVFFKKYSGYTKGKLASYKQIRNGKTICDFISVRVGTTGYMYDKVSGKLFGNDGTGDFILGPDIV